MAHFRIIEHTQIAGHLVGKSVQFDNRAGGYGKRNQYAGNRRMDTGFEEQHPDKEPDYIIKEHIIHPHLPAGIQQCQQSERDQKRLESDVTAIKQGDNNNAADIVHHS